jgi:hypothetical protein
MLVQLYLELLKHGKEWRGRVDARILRLDIKSIPSGSFASCYELGDFGSHSSSLESDGASIRKLLHVCRVELVVLATEAAGEASSQ